MESPQDRVLVDVTLRDLIGEKSADERADRRMDAERYRAVFGAPRLAMVSLLKTLRERHCSIESYLEEEAVSSRNSSQSFGRGGWFGGTDARHDPQCFAPFGQASQRAR